MPSILTIPPAVEPILLAEAKAYLHVLHSDEDPLLSQLIIAARHHIEAATGLKLIQQGWSVFCDDWPETSVIELPLAPVIAITDVKTYGEDNIAAIVDPAHYYADRVSRPARLILRPDRIWAKPARIANSIEIVLTAGFGATPASVPEPLREAMLQLIAHWYAHRGEDESPMPFAIAGMMAPYRELRL